jgi:membrane protein required for colicin V production
VNGLDVVILVVLAGFVAKGLFRGLLKEVCSLAGLFLGAFLAFRYHGPVADSLMNHTALSNEVAVASSFTFLFLATIMIFYGVGFFLSKVVKLLFLGGINRLVGGVFGLCQGVILLAVILFALSLKPLPWGLDSILDEAHLAPPFIILGDEIFQGSQRIFE